MSAPAADDVVERALLHLQRDLARAAADDDTAHLRRAALILRKLSQRLRTTQRIAATLAALLARALRAAGEIAGPAERSTALGRIGRGVDMLARTHRRSDDRDSRGVDDPQLLQEILDMIDSASGAAGTPALDDADASGDETLAAAERVHESPSAGRRPCRAAGADVTDPAALAESTSDDAPSRLDDLGRLFMSADLSDLSTLGTISGMTEEIAAELDSQQPLAAALSAGLQLLSEALILDEAEDPDDTFERLGEGIELLQRMQIQFERLGCEVDLDPELRAQLVGADAPAAPAEADVAGGAVADPVAEEDAEQDSEPVAVADALPEAGTPDPVAAGGSGQMQMPDIDPDLFAAFSSEASDHLSAAESTLLSLETSPKDGDLLDTVFRAFHTVKGAAGFLNLDDITRVAHAVEDIFDAARKGELTLSSPILDVVLESVDLLKSLIADAEVTASGAALPNRDIGAFLARVAGLDSRGGQAPAAPAAPAAPVAQAPAVDAPDEAATAAEAPAAAEPAVEAVTAEAPAPTTQAPTPPEPRPATASAPRSEASPATQHFVRVGTDKLDQLVNLVGELVISQTQVVQNPEVRSLDNQKLSKDMVQLGKISNDIQEIAMALRMVPIRATFERMARVVRDVARKCGKNVTFAMAGEDTELDKNIVEELVDPLTHMVRNAVDHGVETVAERAAAGKPEQGRVELEAYHKGGNIVIELRDDGKGLDRDKLKRKAVERGVLRADEEISDADANQLIFHAGLSTAEQLSDISGRGVGMDVVRKSIESLRGKVEVDSTPGAGSIFRIRLPLTLAIIDGMVIRVGEERFILPLTSIVRSLRPAADDVFTVLGRGEMVRVQEELFPLVRFCELFGIDAEQDDPEEALIVLLEAEGKRYCILVDELLGMQQVVIKALDEELRQSRSLSGCAILGDGRVGLILDPNGLAREDRPSNRPTAETPVAA